MTSPDFEEHADAGQCQHAAECRRPENSRQRFPTTRPSGGRDPGPAIRRCSSRPGWQAGSPRKTKSRPGSARDSRRCDAAATNRSTSPAAPPRSAWCRPTTGSRCDPPLGRRRWLIPLPQVRPRAAVGRGQPGQPDRYQRGEPGQSHGPEPRRQQVCHGLRDRCLGALTVRATPPAAARLGGCAQRRRRRLPAQADRRPSGVVVGRCEGA